MEAWLENFALANFRRSVDTAHDLKTPLNVAVLNLELLRMRVRKLTGEDDEKLTEYTRAIEFELRRMGRIFDSFFLLSTPPREDDPPVPVDIAAICEKEAAAFGMELPSAGQAIVRAHEPRIREACKMFFEGASRLLSEENRSVATGDDADQYSITVTGHPRAEEIELTKVFKFYYSDTDGSPDLSLAVARLIAETYGGEVGASPDRDRDNVVILELSFPLGER